MARPPSSACLCSGGAPDSARSAGSVSNGPPAGPDRSQCFVQLSDPILDRDQVLAGGVSGRIRRLAQLGDLALELGLGRFAPPELPADVRKAGAQLVALVLQGSGSLIRLCSLPPRVLLGARQLSLHPRQICADARFLLFGSLQAGAQLAQACFRFGHRLVGGRDALFAGLGLLAQARCFGGRLLGGPLQLLDPFPEAGLRRARFRLHLIARRARLGQAGIELGVLPAHRHQFLVHLPRLGRRLLDRLGQLGHPRLGRLLCCCQLAPFGLRRLDLGPQLLILRLQRGELLLQLTGRSDRLRGPGQLLETSPGGRQRLLQLGERVGLARIGGRRTGCTGRLCGLRFGRLLDQDRPG